MPTHPDQSPEITKAVQEIDALHAAFQAIPRSSPQTLKAAHDLHYALRHHWPTLRAALSPSPSPQPSSEECMACGCTGGHIDGCPGDGAIRYSRERVEALTAERDALNSALSEERAKAEKLREERDALAPRARAYDNFIEIMTALRTHFDKPGDSMTVEALLDKIDEAKAMRAERDAALKELERVKAERDLLAAECREWRACDDETDVLGRLATDDRTFSVMRAVDATDAAGITLTPQSPEPI